MRENNKNDSIESHKNALSKKYNIKKIDFSLKEKKSFLKNIFLNNGCNIIAINNLKNGKPFPATIHNIDDAINCHLTGEITSVKKLYNGENERRAFRIGAYNIPPGSNKANKIIIDLDGGSEHKSPLENPFEVANEIYNRCRYIGLHCNVEISFGGKGLHLWIFSDEPIFAYKLRALGYLLTRGSFPLASGGIANPKTGEGIEIFPKQNYVALNSFGNLVWLPWYHLAKDSNNQFINMEESC